MAQDAANGASGVHRLQCQLLTVGITHRGFASHLKLLRFGAVLFVSVLLVTEPLSLPSEDIRDFQGLFSWRSRG